MQPGNCFVIFMWRAAFVCQTSRFILWEWSRASCQPWQCTGYLLPPAGIYFYCSIFSPSTKWLRIDCSNLFIQRWGGSVSHPKITLKSDYIQFLTPGTNIFFSRLPARYCAFLCVHACAYVLLCLCGMSGFVYIFDCVFFRRRSCKPAWSCLGIYWATTGIVHLTFPAALRFITEWLTQALLYSSLNSYKRFFLWRRCVYAASGGFFLGALHHKYEIEI